MRVLGLKLVFMLGALWAHGEVRVAGSNVLGAEVVRALHAAADRHELKLAVDLQGSHPGWQALQQGRADLVLFSPAPGEPLPAAPFHCVPVAYHTVVVLVPATLPLAQLSLPQLAGIFGAAGPGGIRRWGELGLSGDWQGRAMAPRFFGGENDFSAGLFRHLVLDAAPLTVEWVRPAVREDFFRRLAAGEEGIIGLSDRRPVPGDGAVKALAIARETHRPAFGPTAEAVHRGDYPLRWPVYLVFRRSEAGRLFPLLRDLFGEEMAAGWEKSGLTPLPRPAREAMRFDLEQL